MEFFYCLGIGALVTLVFLFAAGCARLRGWT